MCTWAASLLWQAGGIGCLPVTECIVLAEPKALGVCPCRTAFVWTKQRHRACAHAKYYWFGKNEGIGPLGVPMQTFMGLAELKALGVCPCGILWGWQE